MLEKDYRVDDLEPLIKAIGQFRGVLRVVTGEPDDMGTYVLREQIRREMGEALWKALHEDKG